MPMCAGCGDEPVIADGNCRARAAAADRAAGSGSPGGRREPASGFVPGDDERLGVRREQVNCFAKGAGGLAIEGRRFHCYTSRRKTEPSNCMPSVPGERRVRDPQTVVRASRNSQPRSRPGEGCGLTPNFLPERLWYKYVSQTDRSGPIVADEVRLRRRRGPVGNRIL